MKIQPENLAERQLYRSLKLKSKPKLFNETKKKKILKFKEFLFPDTLTQISPANYTKICKALSFPSFRIL